MLKHHTREGFRLLIAWVVGFVSFGVLSELSQHAILQFQPWKRESITGSETELVLLCLLLGIGFLAIVIAVVFEGFNAGSLRVPQRTSEQNSPFCSTLRTMTGWFLSSAFVSSQRPNHVVHLRVKFSPHPSPIR